MLRLEPRREKSKVMMWLTPVLAVLLTMIAGAFLFMALGKDPVEGIYMMFVEPVFDSYSLSQIMVKAAPLILMAIGLSLGFKANIWNIGAEGQFIMGAICGGGVGFALWGYEAFWVMPLMIICGALGGFVWAMIPAILKIKFRTNEILVSLMLVYVAINFLSEMVTGLMRNPQGFNFPESRNFRDFASAKLPMIWDAAGLHLGGVVALGVVVGAYVLLQKHILGYQIRLTGEAPRAARFAGVNPNVIVAVCLGISGALAGLAGLFELTGPAGRLSTNFPLGYGFTAIIVAFLGRLNPFGILLAGIVMAITYIGGETAQFMLSIPKAAVSVFQGMMLFFLLAVDVLVGYRIKFKKTGAA